MSMFTRFLVSLVLLAPSLAHTATLEIPPPTAVATMSGIGVISGWKCQADGELTIRFNDGDPIPLPYGSERTDVRDAGACPGANVGFVAIWNWNKLATGEHTAVAYDNGVEFARRTFTVARASEEHEFLRDVTAQCSVFDFPGLGTNARFEWTQATQGLELAEVGEDVEVPVSTRFDGVWDLTFRDLGPIYNNLEPACVTLGRGGTFTGLLEVKNGQAESVEMEGIGGDSQGVLWFALIRPNGHLEGSWGQFIDDTYITFGSWDGGLDDENSSGQWLHTCGTSGTWGAARRGDS